MATIQFKVRNKDRLLAQLKATASDVEKAVTDANMKSAQEMVDLARGFVPVRTGALRDSIVLTPPGQMTPLHGSGGSRLVPPGAVAVTAGNDKVRYGHLVEFGAPPHIAGGIFEGAEHPGAPPQPFFWPAYRLIRKRAKARVGRAIRNSIKKAGF